jgi:hypothetical protein
MEATAPIVNEVASNISGSEELWAQHGLTGLVIFALIGLLVFLIRSNSTTIKTLISEERSERRDLTDKHVKSYDRLTEAIDGLTKAFYDTKSD